MSGQINHERRRFSCNAAVTTAARLGIIGAADAESTKTNPIDVPPLRRARAPRSLR
jgi:hypothetical protein